MEEQLNPVRRNVCQALERSRTPERPVCVRHAERGNEQEC